jgi:2-amino-4-hydroxy-6-hydroxymethyldihydropteridine diphosphokinase
MYVQGQPPYLNACASLESGESPLELLRELKAIEARIGRKTRQRYGPREVDLDLLAYGAASYTFVEGGETVLEVPHPKIAERRFVLQPLFDLDPEWRLPGIGTVRSLLAATENQAPDVLPFEDAVLSL